MIIGDRGAVRRSPMVSQTVAVKSYGRRKSQSEQEELAREAVSLQKLEQSPLPNVPDSRKEANRARIHFVIRIVLNLARDDTTMRVLSCE